MTYNSNDQEFVVYRQDKNMPNMIFKMHECGLHYYDPSDEQFTFTNTVEGNMAGYTKRQLKGATSARFLYKKLAYPSVGDFRWVVQANQIEECPVTVQDIDVAAQVWGKDLDALKGKTKRSRPIHVASDFVKVPRELLKLHKEVFLTADIFFVNKIPFFLTLSQRIRFTAVNHLADRKIKSIFKALRRSTSSTSTVASESRLCMPMESLRRCKL